MIKAIVVKAISSAVDGLRRLVGPLRVPILKLALRTGSARLLAILFAMASARRIPPPYCKDVVLPRKLEPQPRQRSLLLLHHSYYHFTYLAKALRARGWDAVSAAMLGPDHPSQLYMVGQDIDLFDPDPKAMRAKIAEFYAQSLGRFGMVHFAGNDWMGFFPENFRPGLPWDFVEAKQRGIKIGYTISGCHDGVIPADFNALSGGVCEKCAWQVDAVPCWSRDHSGWRDQLELMCDLIAVETDWPTPPRQGQKYFQDPLTMCLDHREWRPDVEIPRHLLIDRKPGEILLMHSFGNSEDRQKRGRDIKGSGVVRTTIARLIAEGWPIRFIFANAVPNSEMKFLQVQADVVIDQLNYGRYGATTRQALMLGRPVLTSLRPAQPRPLQELWSLRECPVVPTTEMTLYDDLKRLLSVPQQLQAVGMKGREYAVRWHSADACAERFERVYDALQAGQPPAGVKPLEDAVFQR